MRDLRESNWFWIDNALIDRTDLNIYEKMLYACLARHAGNKEYAYPRLETLARELGMKDTRTIVKYTKSLADKGLVVIQKMKGRSNRYYLKNVEKVPTPDVPTSEVPTWDVPTVPTSDVPTSTHMGCTPKKTKTKKTNKENINIGKVDDDILEFLKENGVNTKAIQESILEYDYTLEYLKRQFITALRLKELGIYENAEACFSNALKNEINLEMQLPKPKEKKPEDIKDNPALKKSYEAAEEKERLLKEKEELDKFFNTLPGHIQKSIEGESLIIAKENYDISVAPTMARSKIKYDLIREHLKKQRGE